MGQKQVVVRYWDLGAKAPAELVATVAFEMYGEMYGETFAVHRDVGKPKLWNVSHVGTGCTVARHEGMRKMAIAVAQDRLRWVGEEKVRAAIAKMAKANKKRGM